MKLGVFFDQHNQVDISLMDFPAEELLKRGDAGIGNDKFKAVMDFNSQGEITPKKIVFNNQDAEGRPTVCFIPSKAGLSVEEICAELFQAFPDYKAYSEA